MKKIRNGWLYCKYCYKNVRAIDGGWNQKVCPFCDSGLTPDFFTPQALKDYLSGKEYNKIISSKEYKEAEKKGLELLRTTK